MPQFHIEVNWSMKILMTFLRVFLNGSVLFFMQIAGADDVNNFPSVPRKKMLNTRQDSSRRIGNSMTGSRRCKVDEGGKLFSFHEEFPWGKRKNKKGGKMRGNGFSSRTFLPSIRWNERKRGRVARGDEIASKGEANFFILSSRRWKIVIAIFHAFVPSCFLTRKLGNDT